MEQNDTEIFLSTPSARRATRYQGTLIKNTKFLSTPSARRATVSVPVRYSSFLNFYPRPPRGGRPTSISVAFAFLRFLSTPSARRATFKMPRARRGAPYISIHALREEGDVVMRIIAAWSMLFLSTPSARRATNCVPPPCLPVQYFYPRPPRGGRRTPFRRSK